MNKTPCWIAAGCLSLMIAASSLLAYPKPSVYPVSWQLKFDYNAPKRISVKVPGSNTPQAYWYVTFTLTNKDIEDTTVHFLPNFEMLTKDGQVIRSDKDVPPSVYDAIRAREGKKSLEALDKIRGYIRLGDDQARDGVAVWPEPGPRMGTFSLFFGGLSGETIYLDKTGKEVDTKDWIKISDEDKKSFTELRKTLQVTYTIPGDDVFPSEDVVNLVKQEWIMR